jgi:hypothetical protein
MSYINPQGSIIRKRPLTTGEIKLARSVFGNSIRYDKVYIADLQIGQTALTAAFVTRKLILEYLICWPRYFGNAMGIELLPTFIHEMTHVWQGENGKFPAQYMGSSVISQTTSGISEWVSTAIRDRKLLSWETARSTAYTIPYSMIGKNWSEFNVEQQASLIESWYVPRNSNLNFGANMFGGGMSQHDPRYPYIRDVILKRNRFAQYANPLLAPGADRQIKAIQDRLVALGYLHPRHADGYVGRSNSATLDAVYRFQQRNGLKPDRILGGSNSETRKKLLGPIAMLRKAR